MHFVRTVLLVLLAMGVFYGVTWYADTLGPQSRVDFGAPDWQAIADWPPEDATTALKAQPDPNATIAVLVLDDSGSMSADIDAAKAALTDALGYFGAADQIAVITLNAGVILPVMPVADARSALPAALEKVRADGTTPLTKAVAAARDILTQSAASRRGFGTYRIIITTDGEADDAGNLRDLVGDTVTTTPIQITTIATKPLPRHALNAAGFTGFTTIAGVADLAEALAGAIAENTAFQPVTSFQE